MRERGGAGVTKAVTCTQEQVVQPYPAVPLLTHGYVCLPHTPCTYTPQEIGGYAWHLVVV